MTDIDYSKQGRFSIPDVGNIDVNKLSKKNSSPDYIPYEKRGRDIFGRMTINTGVLWLGGFTSGGIYGVVEGWKGAASSNYKIRFNSIMNSFSKRGSALGNSLGVIALFHTLSVYFLDQAQIERYVDSPFTTPILSGMITGGFYKCTRGPRAMALASVIGGGISTLYTFSGSVFYDIILGITIPAIIKNIHIKPLI